MYHTGEVMLIIGEAMCVGGLGVHGKPLYLSLNFSVNYNCSKNKVIEMSNIYPI